MMREQSEDRTFRNFVIVVGITFATLTAAGLFERAERDTSADVEAAPVEAEALPDRLAMTDSRTLAEAGEPGPRSDDEFVSREVGSRAVRLQVYECRIDGQRVVSDQPCADDARARTLVVDRPDPREVVEQQYRLGQLQRDLERRGSVGSGTAYSGGSPDTGAGEYPTASNQGACEAIDRAIDQLNARMRQRYTSAEGEWLRSQWHSLKERRHELRCGR